MLQGLTELAQGHLALSGRVKIETRGLQSPGPWPLTLWLVKSLPVLSEESGAVLLSMELNSVHPQQQWLQVVEPDDWHLFRQGCVLAATTGGEPRPALIVSYGCSSQQGLGGGLHLPLAGLELLHHFWSESG